MTEEVVGLNGEEIGPGDSGAAGSLIFRDVKGRHFVMDGLEPRFLEVHPALGTEPEEKAHVPVYVMDEEPRCSVCVAMGNVKV